MIIEYGCVLHESIESTVPGLVAYVAREKQDSVLRRSSPSVLNDLIEIQHFVRDCAVRRSGEKGLEKAAGQTGVGNNRGVNLSESVIASK
jgi:hypothetical protein